MTNFYRNKKEQLAYCRLLFCFLGHRVQENKRDCKGEAKNSFFKKLFFASPLQSLLQILSYRTTKFVSIFCLFPILLNAQNLTESNLKEFAVGYSIIHEKLPEDYNYTPLFLTARFPLHQFKSKRKSFFTAFAEPQFVLNNPPIPFSTTFEFGINLGFKYSIPFTKKNGLAFALSAGPHYLSLETSIQAKGFIFSDNIEMGYYQQIGKQFGVSLKSRFRHISNAGLLSPNIGIDNLFLMVGFTWKAL